jgi:hypothetical protein
VNLRADAGCRFFKGKRHVVAQIGAALAALPSTSATPSATENILEAEEVTENILKVLKDGGIESARLKSATAQAGVAKAIVNRALLRVGKHAISLGC